MRKDFHRLLIGQEIFQVILDEDPNTLFRIGTSSSRCPQALTMVLKVCFWIRYSRLFFGLEVVVKPGQRHAAGAGRSRIDAPS